MPADLSRLHVSIQGRVQGVGFRAFVHRKAIEIGLTGWVRNRWDGSVEVLAEGERPSLDRLLLLLKRGPSSAMVSSMDFEWQPATGEFKRFTVKFTV
ncbi:MAG: acylphosphatase [Anaerolineales bacterium]|nr:acylphosphatase [Anaerolineales bacterium]